MTINDPALQLRSPCLADAPAIAKLHVDVWRRTYADLAPAAAVHAIDYRLRLAHWTQLLTTPRPLTTATVAERADHIVGFCLAGPPGDDVYGGRGEIKFLYVASGCQRQGIGRALLAAGARGLATSGFQGVGLGVVEGNEPACRFYEHLGGTVAGHYSDPGPIWRSSNRLYVWDNAVDLARRCEGPR
jgi:ribosomal protein S18 acetylase RimI-like enzyme